MTNARWFDRDLIFQPKPQVMKFAIGLISLLTLTSTVSAEEKEAFGKISKFAQVPATPGFPEGIAVDGNSIFVSGPARFGTAGTGASAIQVFNRKTGQLKQTISVQGEALALEHAVSNIAMGDDGDIFALSTQLGVIRFAKVGNNYVQHAFGDPLPDLPPLPGFFDFTPLPNDIVFDDLGFAYVTDSLQGTIFRYPPCGGQPHVWFQSAQLMGGGFFPFGTNGIRLDPHRHWVYFACTTSATNPNLGTIFRLPLVNHPVESQLEIVHEYVMGEAPDQLAFGEGGTLYVTLAFSNQISVLARNGTEVRISSAPNDEVPMDAPAAIAFDSKTKSLMLANHALFSGLASHFAVLRVFVNDEGDELEKP